MLDVHGDGSEIEALGVTLDAALASRIRAQARRMSVSAATLFHAAWALVIARTSGRDDVVFGTLLSGRLQGSAGAQQTLGMFINTLPLRLRMEGLTARGLVEQTQRELVELLNFEQASLAVAQSCSAVGGSKPLFTTLMNYRHSNLDIAAQFGSAGLELLDVQGLTNYPLSLSVDDRGDSFWLDMETDRRISCARMMGYICVALDSLVSALENGSDCVALALPVQPESERREILEGLNAPWIEGPQQLIHELFEDQVRIRPEVVAAVCNGQSLRFSELNAQANRLARHLRSMGIGPDDLVAISLDRSLELLVAVLGTLKAGGAYVPLDPTYPQDRLAHMLTDAAPKVLVTHEHLRARMPLTDVPLILLDASRAEIARQSAENIEAKEIGLRPDHLAYVIYTSGSTGVPKGALIEHQNVAALWSGLEDQVYQQVEHCQKVALNASINFDASVQAWLQLCSGRTVFIVPEDVRRDPAELVRFVREQRIESIDCTPSQIRLWINAGLLDEGAEHVPNAILVGGEAIDPALWARLAASTRTVFFNVYGPTECTVDATLAAIHGDATAPHIGRPMQHRRIYILDSRLEPVPIGVVGELYVAGAGVGRGYLKREQLTEQRFLHDHLTGRSPSARMYKTGDLARWRADGRIEYVGRNDSQVKVRGYRIELGEIEARIVRNPLVKDAVVIARNEEDGDKRLVAYVVPESSAVSADESTTGTEGGDAWVDQWQSFYEESYANAPIGPSFFGWTSSYTGERIPEPEMQEWLDNTVERIRALRPVRVLEIGCGVGLILQHIAPSCMSYVGTDFSDSALRRLRDWMHRRPDLQHVELLQRSALELTDLHAGSFDVVILNSVVQYFPSIEYAMSVVKEAVRLLRPGGKIFLGDIRHLGLQTIFHHAVQLHRAADTVRVGELRQRVVRAIAQDKELLIDPQFFRALPGRLPGITASEVHLKKGEVANELNRYRYDVILHTQDHARVQRTNSSPLARVDVQSIEEVRDMLLGGCKLPLPLSAIDGRLAQEAIVQELIETRAEHDDAKSLRHDRSRFESAGVHPEALWRLAQEHGCGIRIEPGEGGYLGATLFDPNIGPPEALEDDSPDADWRWSALASDPAASAPRQTLIPSLKEDLRKQLPEHMVPSAWVILPQLPLTPNGKVDRKALPALQDSGRPDQLAGYVPPVTDTERAISDVWSQLLQVERIGLHDNFFELGGHSLHAMKVIGAMSERFGLKFPVINVFQHPTVLGFAKLVTEKLENATQSAQVEVEEGTL